MITVPLIACVYILPTMAGLASIGRWDEWGTDIGTVGYADVITSYWSPAFGIFFVAVAVLANCSIYNTYIASGSRGFFALADDYLAPPVLVKCDEKYGVPYVAVWSIAIVNIILCPMEFTVVIVVDVFLLVASYVMIFISAMILRKRKYGGLSKKDPAMFPVNPKTGLAVGDVKRISFIFFALAAMGGIALAWLPWFEGDWGPDYYLETYGSGFFSSFDGMIFAIKMATLAFVLVGLICSAAAMRIEPGRKMAK